jgi:ABC-type uncharacterized transport system substrate-binding protein
MFRRIVVCLLLTLFLHSVAEAQQPAKIPRIGYLTNESLSATSARGGTFRQGLRELGYVEGKNIIIEWRSAEGKLDRVPALAADLVRLKVDVIVTVGSSVSHSAKEATSTIPIVMAQVNDPVGDGLVASLGRPGGNITGLSTLAPELSGKRLELLKSRLPAVYWRSDFVEAGGLMSYGTSFTDLWRRAATYVDKIIKGAEPANLPVEQPTKFELVINLKAAKQIGLIIPPNVLARADRVIR